MQVFSRIPFISDRLEVIHQDKYAIIICKHYETVFNLETSESIGSEDCFVYAEVGEALIPGMPLTSDTRNQIQMAYKQIPREDRSCNTVYQLSLSPIVSASEDLIPWIMEEVKCLESERNLGEESTARASEGHVKVWDLVLPMFERFKLIARQEPKIIIYNNYCYVFIVLPDETLQVRRICMEIN